MLEIRIQNGSHARRCRACAIANCKLALNGAVVVDHLAQLRGQTVEFVAAEATGVVFAGSSLGDALVPPIHQMGAIA